MGMRWGPGPVFVYESLLATRRWGYYAARAGFGLLLLGALVIAWVDVGGDRWPGPNGLTRAQLARLGQAFYEAIAGVQITLVLFAAPAATAGVVCLDRARGTLTHMMVTDLSDAEIVLGKLAARLLPVLGLVAGTLPVLALVGLLGGVVPGAIATLSLVTVGLAVLGCSMALAVSVRVLKAHEVLMAVYAVLAVWLLSAPVWIGMGRSGYTTNPPPWYVFLNPYALAYAPFEMPGKTGPADLAVFLGVMAAASAALTVWSVWTLRREVTSGLRRSERLERWAGEARARLFGWVPGPSLDANPVLWREWHRNRPSRVARMVWRLYWGLAVVGTAFGLMEMRDQGATTGSTTLGVNGFSIMFALLFLSATAPTVLSEERVRGSLDVLLTTPLSTRSVVLAKWWGVFRVVPWLALMPALGALVFAASVTERPPGFGRFVPPPDPITFSDRVGAAVFPVAWVFAHGALFTSVGVCLATWIARPGRAIAASVLVYLTVLIGTIVAAETVLLPLFQHVTGFTRGDAVSRALEEGLVSLSPFGGQVVPLEVVGQPWFTRRDLCWTIEAAAVTATLMLAAGLLRFTVATFDRRLGRLPEGQDPLVRPQHPGRRPRAEAEPAGARHD